VRRLLTALLLLPLAAWAAAALWFDAPMSRPAAAVLALLFAAACAVPFVLQRSAARAATAVLLLVGTVLAWWLSIQPRNDRDWLPDVARPARAQLDGSRLTIENVRDFRYRSETDFDERWETRTFDLDRLRSLDLFLSHWGSPHIAHTIVSWDFEDGPPLAVSIETRKEKGESYSAIRGFFRQYELYYVVADERDLIALRTGPRGEDTYLYRIELPPERARILLLDYVDEINHLAEHPRWYNALTHNCTTAIRWHVQRALGAGSLHWKILANGHYDELLYARGAVDTSLPFAELRARSAISARAKAAGDGPDFSARIREGLPELR
jgi:hypothetical protein